jgi:HK97 family phage major capsid protein
MSTKFQSFGPFAHAVRTMKFDPSSQRSISSFGSSSVASDGGFAVPVDFANEIFMRGEGSLVPYCQVIPSASSSINVPVDEATPWATTGILASWDDEGSQATPRKPVLSMAEHKLRKLRVLVPVSEELVADAPAFNVWFPLAMNRAVAWKMNDAIINGPGVARPLGILSSPALIEVPKVGGQTAATINDQNIADMLVRCLDANSSVWIANPGAYGQLSGLSSFDSGARRLAGLPIVLTDACAQLGSRGDLILAGMGGYRLVTKGPAFHESAHIWFDQDLHAYRLTVRVDGQPILREPTTPANSSVTRSHFVTLAVRA